MTFIFGGLAVGKPFEQMVWFFAVLVMLIDLGEEIAADAMDMDGDRLAGSRSLPLLIGRENALRVSAMVFILVILTSCLPFLFARLEWIYGIPVILMDTVILYSTTKLLDSTLTNRRKYIRWVYLSGLVALLVFISIRMFK
jgi:geranylgeranylglycerol-phosphate geranylgeranyltransferase